MGGRRDRRRRRVDRGDRARTRRARSRSSTRCCRTWSTKTTCAKARRRAPSRRASRRRAIPTRPSRKPRSSSEGEYGIAGDHPLLPGAARRRSSSGTDDKDLTRPLSTQNVSGIAGADGRAAQAFPPPTSTCSRTTSAAASAASSAPTAGASCAAQLSKKAGGKPVKLMLERDAELTVAGDAALGLRARSRSAPRRTARITAWESRSWGTGGLGGGGTPPHPLRLRRLPTSASSTRAISTNIGRARAWRAPNHPQACLPHHVRARGPRRQARAWTRSSSSSRTSTLTELARRRLSRRAHEGGRADRTGRRTGIRAATRRRARCKRGLGLVASTPGAARGHDSDCDLTIHPDGSVEVKIGTQDLGTGTRTVHRHGGGRDARPADRARSSSNIGDTQLSAVGRLGRLAPRSAASRSSTRRAAVERARQAVREGRARARRAARRARSRGRQDPA